MWEPEAKTKPGKRQPIQSHQPTPTKRQPRFEPGQAVCDQVVADLSRDPRAEPPHGRRARGA